MTALTNAAIEGEKDEVYYWDTVIFLLEGCIFKVPRYQFVIGSTYFAERLRSTKEGDGAPVIPEGATASQFRVFLKLLFPINTASTTLQLTKDEWLIILELSTRWHFHEFRKLAKEHLDPQIDDPIERIVVGRAAYVPTWVLDGYESLVTRPECISEHESERIGHLTTVRLYILRHEQCVESCASRFREEIHALEQTGRDHMSATERRMEEEKRLEEERLRHDEEKQVLKEEEERWIKEDEEMKQKREEQQRMKEEAEKRANLKEENEMKRKWDEEQRMKEEERRWHIKEEEIQKRKWEEEQRMKEAEEQREEERYKKKRNLEYMEGKSHVSGDVQPTLDEKEPDAPSYGEGGVQKFEEEAQSLTVPTTTMKKPKNKKIQFCLRRAENRLRLAEEELEKRLIASEEAERLLNNFKDARPYLRPLLEGHKGSPMSEGIDQCVLEQEKAELFHLIEEQAKTQLLVVEAQESRRGMEEERERWLKKANA
ncbi:hypothetical protein H1R20_g12547, partial [Candolleomyces eurysporus]